MAERPGARTASAGRLHVEFGASADDQPLSGIVIMMNYSEHDPPHFHARYGPAKISVRIADGAVTGSFPTRALQHVLEWWKLHRPELMENWQLARQHLPLRLIEPLE